MQKSIQLFHVRKHERMHTGVEPYECKQCGEGCNDHTSLKTHERNRIGKKNLTSVKHVGKSSVFSIIFKNMKGLTLERNAMSVSNEIDFCSLQGFQDMEEITLERNVRNVGNASCTYK